MVAPDQNHFIFSPSLSYRTTHLPSASNNNKMVKGSSSPSSNLLLAFSRKSLFSRTNPSLPPLEAQNTPRTRHGRTVPSSRANSSKISRLENKSSKRSRSASEDPASAQKSQDMRTAGRAQQITQTVRVLRARSALLLPTPTIQAPNLHPLHHPPTLQPLVLKSEERKKRR